MQPDPRPAGAIALVATEPLLPAALFAARRLVALGSPAAIVLFTDSERAFELAERLEPKLAVRAIELPAELADSRVMHELMFFRFAIPHILGDEFRRTLYLDVDIFVEDDRIFRLFDLDMAGHAIAAVRDFHMAYVRPEERQATLGPCNRKYLNAGMLLIDNRRFMEQGIAGSVAKIAEARAGNLEQHDQSALNIVLKGDWLELSPSFNMLPQAWVSFVRRVYEPVVVHFAGIAKPWEWGRFGLAHRSAADMRQFFSTPPWKEVAEACVPAETRQAWACGTPQVIEGYDLFFFGKSRLTRLLREAPFADVQQGLTVPHFEHLP